MKSLKKYASFFEALKLSDYKVQLSTVGKPDEETAQVLERALAKLSEIKGITKSRNGHRLYLPVPGGNYSPADISPDFEKAMEELVGKVGYSDPDMEKGTIKEPVHGRVVKFSKAFRDLSDKGLVDKALADYASSSVRYGARGANMLVFTAHPYDKAGASTNRDWTSCTTISTEYQNPYSTLGKLMKGTNILVYYTDISDTNLRSPKGRTVLSVYSDDAEGRFVLWPDPKIYGNFPLVAYDFLQDTLLDLFPDLDFDAETGKLHSSIYDESGAPDTGYLTKRKEFVLTEPFVWESATQKLRDYVARKYNITFDEEGYVDAETFTFPIMNEPYYSDKLPFKFKNIDSLTINKCQITDFSCLPNIIEFSVCIDLNKALINLDTMAGKFTHHLRISNAPNFVRTGNVGFVSLNLQNTPSWDPSEDGEYTKLETFTIKQNKNFKAFPLPVRAPKLERVALGIKDPEWLFQKQTPTAHIKELYPTLTCVTFTHECEALHYVPDFYLSESDDIRQGHHVMVTTNSIMSKILQEIYINVEPVNDFFFLLPVAIAKAITKDAIYWDELPDILWYVNQEVYLGELPKTGEVMGKKIITA